MATANRVCFVRMPKERSARGVRCARESVAAFGKPRGVSAGHSVRRATWWHPNVKGGGNEEIRDAELIDVRWVVTAKPFSEKKAQGQAGHLWLSSRRLGRRIVGNDDVHSTRRAMHCFLQVAAHYVSGAFLQCREQHANRYAVPVNEPADTRWIRRGKTARLRKAGSGLLTAPKNGSNRRTKE